MSSELPNLLSVQAQAVVDRAKSLGLTWTLRPATVLNANTNPGVIYDGDTEAISSTPLVDTVISGDRVMMLQVPPGGNYIIGRLSGAALRTIGTQYGTLGTLATAAVTPEVVIPTANWVSEPTFTFPTGRIFQATLTGGIYSTAGAPRMAGVRLRLGQATITGTILLYRPWLADLIGGVGGSYDWTGYFKNSGTSTVSSKLSLTLQNVSSAGTVGIYGDASQPNMFVIRDFCALGDDTDLAGVCISV